MSAKLTEETVKALYATLSQTFSTQKDVLNKLAASADNPTYGDTLKQAFEDAEKTVLGVDNPDPGSVMAAGARALKTDAEPLLPFLLFELGKACSRENALTLSSFQEGLKNAVMSVVRVGGVRYGQGSLLDALIPASERAHEAQDLSGALTQAAKVAGETAWQAKHPGMTSVALVLESLAQVFGEAD